MRRCAFVAALVVAPSTALAADPDALGPHEVQRNEYGFGDIAFEPTGLQFVASEIRGVIHSPADLDQGPFPLVIVLHGRHASCYDPDDIDPDDPFANASQEWPCAGGHEAVPSYVGYDYWAANLASHGYVVVSIGANGIAAFDNSLDDLGASVRGELIATHLELWQAFSTSDEYGTQFNGAVDLQNVGLVGHSRGGEGVAAFLARDAAEDLPYTVNAAMLLAPIDVGRIVTPGVALSVVLPYCDGDVFDLQGAHYYDDTRHAVAGDTAAKYLVAMAGSNHNFYNTVWSPTTFPGGGGAADDFAELAEFMGIVDAECSPGPRRLSEAEQQASFVAFANAFFRTHLGDEAEFAPFLRGDEPGPASAAPAEARISYLPADVATQRRVINRIADLGSLTVNDLGGTVVGEGLSTYALCGVDPNGGDDYAHCVADPGQFMGDLFEGREPHAPGLAHLRLGFASESSWINTLPPTDVSMLSALQFRATVDFEDAAYAGADVDLTVAITDAAGVRATTTVAQWSDALAAPRGDTYPLVPKLLLGGVRVPLSAFLRGDGGDARLDLGAIVEVALVFDQGPGAILLSDLAFVDAVPEPPDDTTSTGGDATGTTSVADTSGGVEGTTTANAADTTASASDAASEGTGGGQADGGGDDGCGCTTSTPRSAQGLLGLLLLGLPLLGPWRRRVQK